MDRPEEAAESVNPREQGLSSSEPSESNVPNEPTEALMRISQEMARVLDRLTAPKAPIDTVRRHGAEEFHGSSMDVTPLFKTHFIQTISNMRKRLRSLQ